MTRYRHVIEILDTAIGGPNASIGVHGTFWRGLTRDQFVATKVKLRREEVVLLVVGKGSDSNLVKALKGQSPFGNDLPKPPPGAKYPRMPYGFDPVPDPDIGFIEKWIDDRCPEDPFVAAGLRTS